MDVANKERLDDEFRKRFRRARGERSQKEIADALTAAGYPIDNIGVSRLERGERGVNLDLAIAAANVFDLPMDAMLGRHYGLKDDLAYALRTVKNTARRVGVEVQQLIDELDEDCAEAARYTFQGREQFDDAWRTVVGDFREGLRHLLYLQGYDVTGPVGVDRYTPEQRAGDKEKRAKDVEMMRDAFRRSISDGEIRGSE